MLTLVTGLTHSLFHQQMTFLFASIVFKRCLQCRPTAILIIKLLFSPLSSRVYLQGETLVLFILLVKNVFVEWLYCQSTYFWISGRCWLERRCSATSCSHQRHTDLSGHPSSRSDDFPCRLTDQLGTQISSTELSQSRTISNVAGWCSMFLFWTVDILCEFLLGTNSFSWDLLEWLPVNSVDRSNLHIGWFQQSTPGAFSCLRRLSVPILGFVVYSISITY